MGTYPVFGQTERWIPRVRLLKHRCSGRRSQEKRELLKEAASEIRKAGQSCRGWNVTRIGDFTQKKSLEAMTPQTPLADPSKLIAPA